MSDDSQPKADQVEAELSRQLFHLKTLYDVSRELIGLDSIASILHSFLLMSTGNFGVLEGFIYLYDRRSGVADKLERVGIHEEKKDSLSQASGRLLARYDLDDEDRIVLSDKTDQHAFPDVIKQILVFKVSETTTGVMGLGSKIVGEAYSDDDLDLLETLVNNLIAALKNAIAAEALRDAYNEVSSLNRAKDKVINHLSHELKTPIALLVSSLFLLKRALSQVKPEKWESTIQRAERGLKRLSGIQQEVEDIMQVKPGEGRQMICHLLDQCVDELETFAVEASGKESVAECIRAKIDKTFGMKEIIPEKIDLGNFISGTMESLRQMFSHRRLDLNLQIQPAPPIYIPREILKKVLTGLIRNAVENTPDGGKIDVSVKSSKTSVVLCVHDHGVGILDEHQLRIFEGFFPTQETGQYSSKQPFDFNAGGKGADLLRMKIFSERYGFNLDFESERCRHIPGRADTCPGHIDNCPFCKTHETCFESGGTTFSVTFYEKINRSGLQR